jgi:hypothetical protein
MPVWTGDAWTWTALDADTKLIVSWLVADCGVESASEFIQELSESLGDWVHITTDGHYVDIDAVEEDGSAWTSTTRCWWRAVGWTRRRLGATARPSLGMGTAIAGAPDMNTLDVVPVVFKPHDARVQAAVRAADGRLSNRPPSTAMRSRRTSFFTTSAASLSASESPRRWPPALPMAWELSEVLDLIQ